MKLLIYNEDITDAQIEELRETASNLQVVSVDNDESAAGEISDAEVLYGRITPELFREAKNLKWIQAPIAGLEHYLFRDIVDSDVIVTNMRGIYSDHLADHGFAFVLAFARDLPKLFRCQMEGVWEEQENVEVKHLADLTLGVIGLGGIGYEVARRGWVTGMRVLAVDPRRTDKPAEVEELWPADRLDDLLAQSDFVVICAPQTPETEGLIGADQLARMKPTAYLINIGRGVIVKLDDLVEALNADRIAGAALDVYEIEPLPAEHPLWKMPNVLLTPHVAGIDPHTLQRRFGVLRDNVGRYVAGEPLANVVDKRQWF